MWFFCRFFSNFPDCSRLRLPEWSSVFSRALRYQTLGYQTLGYPTLWEWPRKRSPDFDRISEMISLTVSATRSLNILFGWTGGWWRMRIETERRKAAGSDGNGQNRWMRVIGLARFPPQVKISFWGAQNLYQVRSLPHRCVCQFIRISSSSEENDLIGRAPRRDAHYDRHPHFYSSLLCSMFGSIQLY